MLDEKVQEAQTLLKNIEPLTGYKFSNINHNTANDLVSNLYNFNFTKDKYHFLTVSNDNFNNFFTLHIYDNESSASEKNRYNKVTIKEKLLSDKSVDAIVREINKFENKILNDRETSLLNILNYYSGWNKNVFKNVKFNSTQEDMDNYIKAVYEKMGGKKGNFDLSSSMDALMEKYYNAINIDLNTEIKPMSLSKHCSTGQKVTNQVSFPFPEQSKIFQKLIEGYRENISKNDKDFAFSDITEKYRNFIYPSIFASSGQCADVNKVRFPDGHFGIERSIMRDNAFYYEILHFKENFNVPSLINFLSQYDMKQKFELKKSEEKIIDNNNPVENKSKKRSR